MEQFLPPQESAGFYPANHKGQSRAGGDAQGNHIQGIGLGIDPELKKLAKCRFWSK